MQMSTPQTSSLLQHLLHWLTRSIGPPCSVSALGCLAAATHVTTAVYKYKRRLVASLVESDYC